MRRYLNECFLGYHGTGNADPTQTYSPLNFDSTGLFDISGRDTTTASHEVGEWMDDPFGNTGQAAKVILKSGTR